MLYDAFREGTRIVVVGDFDADGATSTALSVLSLRALGCENVTYPCRTGLKTATASARKWSIKPTPVAHR